MQNPHLTLLFPPNCNRISQERTESETQPELPPQPESRARSQPESETRSQPQPETQPASQKRTESETQPELPRQSDQETDSESSESDLEVVPPPLKPMVNDEPVQHDEAMSQRDWQKKFAKQNPQYKRCKIRYSEFCYIKPRCVHTYI